MVVYILSIQADLENIESLSLTNPESLCLTVRNPMDAAQTREKIEVDCRVLHNTSLTNSSGKQQKHRTERPSHFALKWDRADAERATIRVLGTTSDFQQDENPNPHGVPNHDLADKTQRRSRPNQKMSAELEAALAKCRSMTADDDTGGGGVPMLALDCHGLEPIAFHPGTEFTAVGKNGKTYANIDLSSDGDWSDYDLSTGSVSVTNLVGTFQ